MNKWSLFGCVFTYLTLNEQNELLPMMSQITCRPQTQTALSTNHNPLINHYLNHHFRNVAMFSEIL